MKQIKFTLTGADGENLGSFTLDPLTQIRLMADAKVNKGMKLHQYVREVLRQHTLVDDYPGVLRGAADGRIAAAISEKLAAA